MKIPGKKPHGFRPTPAMQLFAFQKAKLGNDATIAECARRVGITRESASRWQGLEGFNNWLEEQVAVYKAPIKELLEQVALKNLDDFRYWEAMAKKYGLISDKPQIQPNDPNYSDEEQIDADKRVIQLAERILEQKKGEINESEQKSEVPGNQNSNQAR